MDVNELIARVRPRFWLIVALAVLGAAAGLAASRISPTTYHAEARVMVGQTAVSRQVDYTDLLASQLLAQTYTDLATSGPVLQTAGDSLKPTETAAQLDAVVSARAPVNSIYVIIGADASDATRAADIANAVAQALVATAPAESQTSKDLQSALQNDLVAVDGQVSSALAQIGTLTAKPSLTADEQKQLADLQAQLDSLRSQRATLAADITTPGSNVLTLVDPAAPPAGASSPRTVVDLGVGLLLGLVVGLAFALLASRRRTAADAAA
ncbi:MAG: Wzz/FepE/Etk N-terminal domain-containing protein [Candidatus Limnocylindrales bacterium]